MENNSFRNINDEKDFKKEKKNEYYRIPKQLNSKIEVVENI